MSTINERIKKLVEHFADGNNSKFAELVATSEANIRNYQKDTQLKSDVIATIAQNLEINYEWLLSGKGRMIKEPEPISIRNSLIPLIPVEAIAGYAEGNVQLIDIESAETYLVPEFKNKGAKFFIKVSGNSMYPKYSNGDLLACRPVTDISFFQWGKAYVLDTDQGALVKRLFACEENDNFLICHSDNSSNYPDFKINKTSIRSVAIVLGVLRVE